MRYAACIGALLFVEAAFGAEVVLAPSQDNSMYSEDAAASNGMGQHLFSGNTQVGVSRRALLAFDVAAAVPAGSTIDAVSLTLHVSKSPPGASDQPFSLHRVLTAWGEGDSDAIGAEGSGAPAQDGDATWTDCVYPGTAWATAGGDYVGTESASLVVPPTSNAFVTWGSTAATVADVQGWLDAPASNLGWIVVGEERFNATARRFDSVQNPTAANRPALTVQFTPPPSGPGAVPDGDDVPGTPLRLAKAVGGSLNLVWGNACLPSADYAIYEGILGGTFSTHAPLTCATGGTQATIAPATGSSYYLVVAQGASAEGSYGKKSGGGERSPAASPCASQLLLSCP